MRLARWIDGHDDCFGSSRLLYGSDWPVVTLGGGAGLWRSIVDAITATWTETERRALFADNATRIYGLSRACRMADSHEPTTFAGRTAIVTGGGSGIGQAIATLFARARRTRRHPRSRLRRRDGAGDRRRRRHRACTSSATSRSRRMSLRAFAEVRERVRTARHPRQQRRRRARRYRGATTEADLDRIYARQREGRLQLPRARRRAMKGRGGVDPQHRVGRVHRRHPRSLRLLDEQGRGAHDDALRRRATTSSRGSAATASRPARVHTPFVDGFLATNYPGREAEMFDQLVEDAADRADGHARTRSPSWRCFSAPTRRRSSPAATTPSTAASLTSRCDR